MSDRVVNGDGIEWDDATLALVGQDGSARARFVFSYTALRDAKDGVHGLFCVCREPLRNREVQLRDANVHLERRINENTTKLPAREILIQTFYRHCCECRAVLSEVPGATFRYVQPNPATLKLYGMTRQQVIGRTFEEIMDLQSAALLNGYFCACLRADVPHRYERVQGHGIREAVATPVPQESGSDRGVVFSARDGTKVRRPETQLLQSQKAESFNQLTGSIAHYFNNLLTGIHASLEILQMRVSQGRCSELGRYSSAGQ